MKIAFVVQAGEETRTALRLGDLPKQLRQWGHSVDLKIMPKSTFARLKSLSSWGSYDVLVLPAHLYAIPWLWALRTKVRGLILDLDDAIDQRPADSSVAAPSKTRARRFQAAMKCVDAVTVAGHDLFLRLQDESAHSALHLIPTVLPSFEDSARQTPVRLLWLGSRSSVFYLERFLKTSEAMWSGSEALEVVSDGFPQSSGRLKLRAVEWSEDSQARSLASDAVGLYPLNADPWSRGKSGYKVLKYMSAGLPVVSVEHGNGRFLLGSDYPYCYSEPAEAVAHVEELCQSEALRRKWGEHLRAQARQRFSTSAMAKLWLRCFEQVIATRS